MSESEFGSLQKVRSLPCKISSRTRLPVYCDARALTATEEISSISTP